MYISTMKLSRKRLSKIRRARHQTKKSRRPKKRARRRHRRSFRRNRLNMAKKTLKYSGGGFGLGCQDINGNILQPKCRYTLELPGKILTLLNLTLQELEFLCPHPLTEPALEEEEDVGAEEGKDAEGDDENKAQRGAQVNPRCSKEATDFLPKVQETITKTVTDLKEASKQLNTMEPTMVKGTNANIRTRIIKFKKLLSDTTANIEKFVPQLHGATTRMVNSNNFRSRNEYGLLTQMIGIYQKLIIFQQRLIQISSMEMEQEAIDTTLTQLNSKLLSSQLKAGTTPWEGLDGDKKVNDIQKLAETCDNMENDDTSQFVWAYTMKKFSTKKKDRCKTFTTALRYIYFIISGTEGIMDTNAQCEKENKRKAPWYKKPKFISLLAAGRDQLPAIYRMCLTIAIGILWKLEGKCRLLVYMFFPDFITSIIAQSWRTNKGKLKEEIRKDWSSLQNYYKHARDLVASHDELKKNIGWLSLETAYENIRTGARMPKRHLDIKQEELVIEINRQEALLNQILSEPELNPLYPAPSTNVPPPYKSATGKQGGGQFTDEILSVSRRKGIKGVIRRLTRFFILMLSIPDLVDNCPNNRQSGDKMTRVLAQFGKEKLVYMVDFKEKWEEEEENITEKNVSGLDTIIGQFHAELDREKDDNPVAALVTYQDFLKNIGGLSQNEQLLKVGKIKEAREKYGKAEIAAATLEGDNISPILQESVQRDLTSKLQAIVRCTMLPSYDDAICKKAIKDFEERLQDIKWHSKERMRKASLPSSEHEEKEQPSTDDDDDSELDPYTADVAARGGARMKAGEESSWERLIAEQNRQLEEYSEKAAKAQEQLKSYNRTIAHEKRQITSNSGNPAAAAAARRRKKAAEAKALPVMKRWKTFNRNIEKIQERRRGIYAKIEEQRKAERVARDALRASASQRYASRTMEALGKAGKVGEVPRGKGRGKKKSKSPSRSKPKAAAAAAAPIPRKKKAPKKTPKKTPIMELPEGWETGSSIATMGKSTPESEEIQNLTKSPFAQGEAGSDRGWDITTLDNQFPRPQDISLADIHEALARIINVEHAVREDFERRQEQLRHRRTRAADNAQVTLEARYTPIMEKIKEIQRILIERNKAIGDVVARPGEEVDPEIQMLNRNMLNYKHDKMR